MFNLLETVINIKGGLIMSGILLIGILLIILYLFIIWVICKVQTKKRIKKLKNQNIKNKKG